MTKHDRKAWTRTRVTRVYLVSVMLVFLFISYQAFTTPLPTRKPDEQQILNSNIPAATPGPPDRVTAVENGEPLMLMEIPRFGEDWLWTALEGIDLETLSDGPGHYPGTELPGEEGNSAFAAHRAGHGDPFIDFDLLEVGDEITLSQPGAEWVYEVTMKPEIIDPSDNWVLDDVAGGGVWLTLTTCWPKYGDEKRMYVRARLTD